jgi:hypothetical protein
MLAVVMDKTTIKSAGGCPPDLPRRLVASKPREDGSLGEGRSASGSLACFRPVPSDWPFAALAKDD